MFYKNLLKSSILLLLPAIGMSQTNYGLTDKYTGLETESQDFFARDISVFGRYLFAGAPDHGDGAVYVFDTINDIQLHELKPLATGDFSEFGLSVAGDRNNIVVLANKKNSLKQFLYVFDTNSGQQLLRFEPAGSINNSFFSKQSLALLGNTIVAGYDQSVIGGSVAYLFDVQSGQQLLQFSGSDTNTSDSFGNSVAISSNYLVVGAPKASSLSGVGGQVYVFDRNGDELHILNAFDGETGTAFGESVAVHGNTIVVGATVSTNDLGVKTGAAYVFNANNGAFKFKISPNDLGHLDRFGDSVDVRGTTIAVSSRRAGEAIYVYSTASPGLVATLSGSTSIWGDVQIWGDRIFGADHFGGSSCDAPQTGAVLEFTKNASNADLSCSNVPKCNGISATIVGSVNAEQLRGTIGQDVIVGLGGDDIIFGLDGADYLCAGDGNDTVYGGNGDDFIDGGDDNDLLFGQSGDDFLLGSLGDDRLIGGDDNDTISGEEGNDTLLGGNGDDQLDGGLNNDNLNGGNDDDSLLGQNGNDRLVGGAGADQLNGGSGDDVMSGQAGNDRLEGAGGEDRLVGGTGDDILLGGTRDDILFGQDGNDRLIGGPGIDILNGGAGVDTCPQDTGQNTELNCE